MIGSILFVAGISRQCASTRFASSTGILVRSVSNSGNRGGGVPMKLISPEELLTLNRTTVSLYRLLLKESRAVGLRPTDQQKTKALHGRVLLMPPVDPGGSGMIQHVEGTSDDESEGGDCYDAAAWSIISFFRRQTDDSRRGNNIMSHVPSLHDYLISQTSRSNPHQYHLVNPDQLVHAVRSAFLRMNDGIPESLAEDIRKSLTKDDIILLHRRAIDAVRVLHEQLGLSDCTSIGVNYERGVRVFATSKFRSKGFLSRGAGLGRQEEHVFVYRIRVENFNKTNCSDRPKAVRLLGRRWKITDPARDGDDDEIDSPGTGVVGYHPVLQPGNSFEYYSGCNIISPFGRMEGCYYMCEAGADDETLRVGDEVEALDIPKDDDRLFQTPIESFVMDAGK
mmetsp:Transcript_33745/g.74295  ORF Transcript_33745/g.74295 Transcript_33745/m.74295 type:complete len:395 (-) Transcript_33745:163-1347(-)